MTLTPNFFIAGTPKSGTTSLFHYLQEHPEVFLPELKEPHFFSCPEVKSTYYKTKIVDSKQEYLDLYQERESYKAVGDLSSSYLFNKETPKRIHQFNPYAKIIIVLRNPVERALSHYLMDVNLGYINVSLSKVINNKDTFKQHYQEYIELGFYEQQIRAYTKQFPDSQIKVVLSDTLYANTAETLKDIYSFINVSTTFITDFETVHNSYTVPRFKALKSLVQSDGLKKMIPSGLKSGLKSLIYKTNAEKPKLEVEKNLLREIYKKSIVETETLINQDLSSWKLT